MTDKKTRQANTCQTLCVYFVPGYVSKLIIPYGLQEGMKLNDEGGTVFYGSLTFIREYEKVLHIEGAVPFDCSGGRINKWFPLPWTADDVLYVTNGQKGENLRYLWKKEWTVEELLAAHFPN